MSASTSPMSIAIAASASYGREAGWAGAAGGSGDAAAGVRGTLRYARTRASCSWVSGDIVEYKYVNVGLWKMECV